MGFSGADARRGLVAALSAQLDATASPVALDVDESMGGRLDPAVEAAAYLFCVEVVASATDGVVRLQLAGDELVADVRRGTAVPGPGLDTGSDGAPWRSGSTRSIGSRHWRVR